MKKYLMLLLTFVFMLCLVACTEDSKLYNKFACYLNLDTTKGLEIYGWQEETLWSFGVLPGTNKQKTKEEIDNLKPASIVEMRSILSTYSEEQKKQMQLFVIDYPCTDNYLEKSLAYAQANPDVIDELIYDLKIASFTKKRWKDSSDKRDLFASFLEEKSIKDHYASFQTSMFEDWLGMPNEKSQSGEQLIYTYYLYQVSQTQVYVAEIYFNQSCILTDIKYKRKDNELVLPTGTYDLVIIDKGNFIFDKPVLSTYAPGTIFKFHCKPIMDVDLGLYVGGNFECIQKTIFLDGSYLWEYEFEMPNHSVVLEFKICESLTYSLYDLFAWGTDVNKETLKGIEMESGYIAVAPENHHPKIEYSEDPRDIEYNVTIFIQEKLKHTIYDIDGGSYRKVTYHFKNGKKETIEIFNGIVKVKDDYYRFTSETPRYPHILYGNDGN